MDKLKPIIAKIEKLTGIQPYYYHPGCVLYHADCKNILSILGDNSIHLLLTDPPYGTGVMSRKPQKKKYGGSLVNGFQHGKYKWDKIPSRKHFAEMIRVSRNQVIFGYQYFSQLKTAKCLIVWDKKNGGNNFGDCEIAWTSFDRANKIYRYLWNGMITEEQDKRYKVPRIHPNQKPTGLFTGILSDFAKKGHIILDPFAGSGTTGAACHKLGLTSLLIEKELSHCQKAKERLIQDTAARVLFA